ncbi:MAG: PH domain-containing protein, partial [Chloroflexota bacterium]|nr:PH domain-containing protein [Chloroflexota bacterium]
ILQRGEHQTMDENPNAFSKFVQEIRGTHRGRYLILGGVLITILGCVSAIFIGALSPNPEKGTTGSALAGFSYLISLSMLCGGVVIVIIGGITSLLRNRKTNNRTTETDLSVSAYPDSNLGKAENSAVQLPPLQLLSSELDSQSVQPLPDQQSLSQPSSQIIEKDKAMTNQSASPQQPAQPNNLLKKFLSEEQDPAQVQHVFAKVQQILTHGEEILYIAVQKRLINLSPDSVVLTNKRFIVYRPTFLGGANFQDYIWRDLHDARLTEGIINSTVTLQTVKSQVLSVSDLPKAQARKLYAFAQEMEEKVLEERRTRDMEEKRAGAGGIVLQGGMPIAPTPAQVHQEEDPMQKLKKLKDMLDAGLITQQEYDTKKTDILSKF